MTANILFQLLKQRQSCRAFTQQSVTRRDIEKILLAARLAPSGANLQPGSFHILTDEALVHFTKQLSRIAAVQPPESPSYSYFPKPMSTSLKRRQRAAGYGLYQALGIDKRDILQRKQQFLANYRFFDAPVALVVTIDKSMGAGCFMDLGMTLMALMMAAESLGYATCGIGALANYGNNVHRLLQLPTDQQVICGIALGVKDPNAAVNQFRTTRSDLSEFSHFYQDKDQIDLC